MIVERFLLRDKALVSLAVLLLTACVPSDPTSAPDAGASGVRPKNTSKNTAPKPTTPPRMPRVAASAAASAGAPAPLPTVSASPPLTAPFQDQFERTSLGPDWLATGPGWQLKDGKLCGQGVRNRGVWLLRTLPTNARIEFDALSESSDGDLKAELWGDGRSGATSLSYTNATSYLAIFGGWKNKFHVLARINEHDPNRLEIQVNPSSAREQDRPVVPGRTYGFRIERTDGKTINWWVDGNLVHSFEDPQPLAGPGHDHFGFNDWDVPVCFDNVRVTPL